MFGQGTYAVTVMEPQENAVVMFMTFPVSEEIKDSVALAAKCIAALRQKYPDLQATNMNSTPDAGRTIADMTLTADGEKGIGHGYFFCTPEMPAPSTSCWPRPTMWNELRPTLTTIAANLAYAPQGVAARAGSKAASWRARRPPPTDPVLALAAHAPAGRADSPASRFRSSRRRWRTSPCRSRSRRVGL